MKETAADFKSLLEWQEQRWGNDHPKIVASLEALADLLQMQGKYVEAEPLYWQILEKKHKLYGANDLRVADTIYDLACLHELQENWAECERLYKWTCDIRCKLLPAGDTMLDESVSKVKEIASKQGHEIDDAALQAVSEKSAAAVPVISVRPFDWNSYMERVRALLVERDYAQAENILRCLVDVAESYQAETLAHAETLHMLAKVQFFKKHVQDSLKSYEKTLALYEKVCGTLSKETATCLEDMADLHCKLSEKSEADFLFKWALQILESLPDSEQQATRVRAKLESIDELCSGKTENISVKKSGEINLGNGDQKIELTEEMAKSEDQVASFLWNQYLSTGKKALEKGDMTGAEMMFSRALEKANEFGVQDARLWQTLCDTASVYATQGKKVRAESLYRSAQQLCEKTLGPHHPDNAKYLDILGSFYESLRDNVQAAICYDRLVNILVKANRPLVEYAAYLKKLEKLHEKPPAGFFD